MGIENMAAKSGRALREDDTKINEANYLAPAPNGTGQALTVSAAGVVAVTVPDDTIFIVITNPVPVRIAYGATASDTVGTYFPAYSCPILPSPEACAAASIYFTAACVGAFAQPWK